MASIFSRIVNGSIPAVKIYEDDATLAFMDINPASKGHTLVISKAEYPDVFTLPSEDLAAVALTVQRVAKAIKAAFNPDGINIVQNNGAASGQTVFHYHVHLIPRWEGDHVLGAWRPHTADPAQLQSYAEQIRDALRSA